LKLLSYIYILITRIRNFFYNNELIKSYKSKSYVISVGNIIAGGTGKTPIIIYLAKMLKNEGYKVGIITGGYKRKSKSLLVVHNANKLSTTVDKAGDEAYMIAKEVGSPLLIHDKKYMALKEMDNLFEIDVVLVDDGFQHRKIYRDLDLVLINQKSIDEEYLIPAGYLREEKKNLKRADAILYRDLNKVIEYLDDKESFKFTSNINTDKITENGAIVVTAIANPSNFINFLIGNNARIEKIFSFKDHHFFSENDIDDILKYCKSNNIKNVYTTEKDNVKLNIYKSLFDKLDINILSIELEIEFGNENNFKKYILNKINEKNNTN